MGRKKIDFCDIESDIVCYYRTPRQIAKRRKISLRTIKSCIKEAINYNEMELQEAEGNIDALENALKKCR